MKSLKFVALLLATNLFVTLATPMTAYAGSSSSSTGNGSSSTTITTENGVKIVINSSSSSSSSSTTVIEERRSYRDDDSDDRSCRRRSSDNGRSNSRSSTSTRQNTSKYYIMVDRTKNILTVWGKDSNGNYTVVKLNAYCSTGGSRTPTGVYSVSTRYNHGGMQALSDGTYAKFCVGLSNGILIHSVCFRSSNSSTPFGDDIDDLGYAVTSGDIRLGLGDAQWLYQNCAEGTPIEIY